jgi:hypothetical protein
MNNKLYVGGLSYSVTDGQLQEIFSAHGTVESARVIADKFTGQSRARFRRDEFRQRSASGDQWLERHPV